MAIKGVYATGLGIIGNGIAKVLSQAGCDITFIDTKQEFLDQSKPQLGNFSQLFRRG